LEAETEKKLAAMIRSSRVAGLGTLHGGAPLVSMVAYFPAADFSAFYIHISRLAQHTQDLLADARVGLMISESDDGRVDPQTLARISILGMAEQVDTEHMQYSTIRSNYMARFPQSAPSFGFGDFGLWQILPESARFVAGFAQAFNLTPDALKHVAKN
jgi:heme oxygenase (biliverdin-IX-beta and delta-forming)